MRKVVYVFLLGLFASQLCWGYPPFFPFPMSQLPKPEIPKPPTNPDGVCLTVDKLWAPGSPDAVPCMWEIVSDPFNQRAACNMAITFRINRAVTDDLDDQGFLIDPQGMIDKGVIAPTVKVEIAMTTVISNWQQVLIPNDPNFGINSPYAKNTTWPMKIVSVNGKKYWNDPPFGAYSNHWDFNRPYWKYGTLTKNIPVSMIRFPKRAQGGVCIPVENRIVLTGNIWYGSGSVSDLIHSIHIPWSRVTVKAMAPIFLVHGTNADHTTWLVPKGDSFSEYFLAYPQNFYGISFSDIDLKPNGSVDTNGSLLEGQIADRLASVGAKQCHIVAHSKGGNDSRKMIYNHYKDIPHRNESLDLPGHFEVLSLYTLETPHRGTVLADISWNSLNAGDQAVRADPNWGDLQTLINWDFNFAHQTPPADPDGMSHLYYSDIVGAPAGHALRDNMTESMQKLNDNIGIDFSHANMGRPIMFYNTAADADWHSRDLKIDDQENAVGSDEKQWPSPMSFLASPAYRMLYRAKEVRANRQTPIPPYNVAMWKELYVYDQNNQGTWNDLVVAISSAKFDGGTLFCPTSLSNYNNILLGNHSGIKTHSMAAAIISQIRIDWTTW